MRQAPNRLTGARRGGRVNSMGVGEEEAELSVRCSRRIRGYPASASLLGSIDRTDGRSGADEMSSADHGYKTRLLSTDAIVDSSLQWRRSVVKSEGVKVTRAKPSN